MILAGIDEAGYGPLLGPLVVGCWAFDVRPGGGAGSASEAPTPAEPAGAEPAGAEPAGADAAAAPPCLWKRLGKLVSRARSKTGKKLHVNDSKEVYSPSTGLKELERSLLTLLFASADPPDDSPGGAAAPANLSALLTRACCSADDLTDLARHPWYAPAPGESFPLEQDALSLRLFANALRAEMGRAGVRVAHVSARVITERRLNHLVAQTRNKASANFSLAAGHIHQLLTAYAHLPEPLVIVCDRQGGREHYGQLLRLMFEDRPLEILQERDGHAEYLLHPPTRHAGPNTQDSALGTQHSSPPARLIFREKAESQSMSTALASMLSKYLRESLMRRFNAFWRTHLPAVAPTAGYYTDGRRFLIDIDAKRRELGITDEALIRSR